MHVARIRTDDDAGRAPGERAVWRDAVDRRLHDAGLLVPVGDQRIAVRIDRKAVVLGRREAAIGNPHAVVTPLLDAVGGESLQVDVVAAARVEPAHVEAAVGGRDELGLHLAPGPVGEHEVLRGIVGPLRMQAGRNERGGAERAREDGANGHGDSPECR